MIWWIRLNLLKKADQRSIREYSLNIFYFRNRRMDESIEFHWLERLLVKLINLLFTFFKNFFLQLYCPNGMSLMGNSGCSPRGKPAATESRYPTTVHGGCFSVSIIHRTLTWTTGYLPCAQTLMHAIAHRGARTPQESLHWKLTLGEKSLAAPGNRTCVSGVPVRCSNQMSYIPILFVNGFVNLLMDLINCAPPLV